VSHLRASARIVVKGEVRMMGVLAEFERAMIRERVKSGLERSNAQGKTLGAGQSTPRRKPQSGLTYSTRRLTSSSSRRRMGLASGRFKAAPVE